MRVLLLADADSSHTLKWVEGLADADVEIGLFSLRPVVSDVYRKLNIPTREMNHTDSTGWLELKLIYIKAIRVVKHFINEFQPDIVHAHYASSYGLIGSFVGFKPYVISPWGTDIYVYPKSGPIYKALLKRTLSKADEIISISEDMAREIELYTNKNVRVIPWGVKIVNYSFNEKKWEGNTWRFATAKSLRPVYNIPTSIESFLQLKAKYSSLKMELHVAGDGPERSKCEEVAGKELNRSVIMHGALDPSDMPEFYTDKHVLINIPDSESFGVSILEASLSGLVPIGTNADGIPEVLKDGESGILISTPSAERCYKALSQIVDNRDHSRNVAKHGRAFVLENFSYDRTIELQKELYQKLIH